MKNKQLQAVVLTKNDPTAWQQAKAEGISLPKFLGMTLTIMGSLAAFIMIASKFDKLMHDPLMGFVGTGIIIFLLCKLFSEFDRRYQ